MTIGSPRSLLHVEGVIVLCAALVAYHEIGASWIKFAVLFLAPDMTMVGYVFGPKVGAAAYNVGHTYTAPFLLWVIVYFAHRAGAVPLCLIWVAHIGFDRMLGFGLKYPSGFKDTHFHRV